MLRKSGCNDCHKAQLSQFSNCSPYLTENETQSVLVFHMRHFGSACGRLAQSRCEMILESSHKTKSS